MHKKLMMACMAIAAFAAFVIAPAASASPVLTDSGVPVPVGTSVEGHSTGITKFTGFGVECTTGNLKGTVTANTGTTIAGEVAAGAATFTGTGTNGDCTSPLGSIGVKLVSKLCFDTVSKTDNVTITGCGANPITFTLTITGSVPCSYKAATVTGTFVTNGPATINISEQEATGEGEGNSFICPTSGKLDMDFDLYTTGRTVQFTVS
jgi:hypothetical protein